MSAKFFEKAHETELLEFKAWPSIKVPPGKVTGCLSSEIMWLFFLFLQMSVNQCANIRISPIAPISFSSSFQWLCKVK